ncbi:thioesterase II family protein [Herbidospora mongoliensis]|uniref:thioesterase II family protein n=1 Tax=Herbidospora mongoliensis TaxID=688067 RepID=UPI000834FDC4|nr:alpha/beta fold hydrolase [Herbidospora mongoliensis]
MRRRWFRGFGLEAAADAPDLICFPHAGGAATAYRLLAQLLTPGVRVLGVQYPGRQDRRAEPAVESVTGLADAVADLLPPDPGRPYALFGHSMGAAVAYETARRIAERGGPEPERLFLSGRAAPAADPRHSDVLTGDAAIVARIRRLGGTASGVLDDPELLEMVLPALRADHAALRTYHWKPGPLLEVPFTVLGGDADPMVTPSEAVQWLEHSGLPGEVKIFKGGHFYLETELAEVAGLLSAALRR